jgi:Flp pilus assembly protein TadG
MLFTDHHSRGARSAPKRCDVRVRDTSAALTERASGAHSERGAVAAELALMLPILLMLMFGMLQLGLTYQRQEAVHAAAREGARVASLPTTTTAQACARSAAALTGTGFTALPTCTATANCSDSTGDVTVTVIVSNTIDIPFFGTQTFDLTGTGNFRCE